MRAVAGAVQELAGVRLDAMVVVNLAGFVRLVDELGGLWIDIPERLVDSNYPIEDGTAWIHLHFEPGCQHLDGRMALAYARSRHQDSDYGRMRRQQAVLLALRRQVDPVALVPKVPALLKVARDTLWTTIRRQDVRGLASLAARVDPRRVARVLFVPSTYPEHLDRRRSGGSRRGSGRSSTGRRRLPTPTSPGATARRVGQDAALRGTIVTTRAPQASHRPPIAGRPLPSTTASGSRIATIRRSRRQ